MFADHFYQYALLLALMEITHRLSATLRTLWLQGYVQLAPNLTAIAVGSLVAYTLDGAIAALATAYVMGCAVITAALARKECSSMAQVLKRRFDSLLDVLR